MDKDVFFTDIDVRLIVCVNYYVITLVTTRYFSNLKYIYIYISYFLTNLILKIVVPPCHPVDLYIYIYTNLYFLVYIRRL